MFNLAEQIRILQRQGEGLYKNNIVSLRKCIGIEYCQSVVKRVLLIPLKYLEMKSIGNTSSILKKYCQYKNIAILTTVGFSGIEV